MSVLPILTQPDIVYLLQKEIGHIPYQFIEMLIKQLYPISNLKTQQIFPNLLRALTYQYKRQMSIKQVLVDQVTNQIVSKTKLINDQFSILLRDILQRPNIIQILLKKNQSVSMQGFAKLLPNKVMEMQEKSDKQMPKSNQKIQEIPKSKVQFNLGVIKQSNKNKQTVISYNKNTFQNKTLQICLNINKKPQCFCPNSREGSLNQQQSFICVHCKKAYHTVCMKKKFDSHFCCYCHLQKMVPTKKYINTLYVGHLRKDYKRHQATFFIPQIASNQRIQIRCLRLKQQSQISTLFPDVAQISFNGHRCREFQPINKQSCLKYRKDEPFNLLKCDFYARQDNMMTISELLPSNKQKQIRCEAQNHLVGVYIIEDINIEELIKQINSQNILGYTESESRLKRSFKLDRAEEQISCQIIKIPLLCPLSTLKIQIPVRGIFCRHFQCFDLKNYLVLISESQNPRWKCQICGALAYQFEVDSITQAILKETSDNQKIKQVIFYKNGDYSSIIDGCKQIGAKKNILQLGIAQKNHKGQILTEQMIRKKPQFVLPKNVQVIELFDD